MATNSFDWSTISRNGAAFQELALDVFAEKYGDEHLTRGPTHLGPDGGSDGHYDGRLFGVRGPWKIACALRSNLSALTRKVKSENTKAKRDGYRGMLVITQLDLNTKQVRTLETCARKGLSRGRVWPRSALERLLQKHRWLAAQHFGHLLTPGFLPASSAEQVDLTDQPDLRLVGRRLELSMFRSFLVGKERVLLVLGPGGAGKSRLLREFAAGSSAAESRRSPWLRLVGRGPVEQGLRELPTHRPLLLCLDDAGRDKAEALELIRFATLSSGQDAKVVLALRAADREVVEGVLQDGHSAWRTIEIGALSHDDALRVVRAEHPRVEDEVARKLVRLFGRNLFLLRKATQLVKKGEAARFDSDEQLRALISRRLIAEARTHVAKTTSGEACERLLLDAALEVPLPFSVAKMSVDLMTLSEAGLMRRVGDTLRFRADVEGDLLLGYLLKQPWAKAHVRSFLASNPTQLHARIVNLAAAGRGAPAEIIRQTCEQWTQVATHSGRLSVLVSLPYCVQAAPDEVTAICQRYAECDRSLTTDSFGPVLIALARSGHLIASLRLARALLTNEVPEGRFSNYKGPALGDELASPVHHKPDDLIGACEEIGCWLDEPGVGELVGLFTSILTTLLSSSMRWTTSEGNATAFREAAMRPTPATIRMRAAALGVLERMMSHHDRRIRLGAAEFVSEQCFAGSGRVDTRPMDATRKREFEALLPNLRSWFRSETDFEILDTLESGLFNRWAAEGIGADAARSLLSDRRVSPTFKAFQLVRSGWNWVYDNRTALDAAPSEGRWVWWVTMRHEHAMKCRETEVSALVGALSRDCATSKLLEQALERVLAKPSHDDRRLEPFWLLDRWCEAQEPQFASVSRSKAADPRVRKLVERAVRRTKWKNDTSLPMAAMKAELTSGSVENIEQVLVDAYAVPRDATLALVRAIVAAGPVDIRSVGLRFVQCNQNFSAEEKASLVELALRDGKGHDWRALSLLLHDVEMKKQLQARASLAEILEKRLVDHCSIESEGTVGMLGHELIYVAESLSEHDQPRRLRIIKACLRSEVVWAGHLASTLANAMIREESVLRVLLAELESWVGDGTLRSVWDITAVFRNSPLRIGRIQLPESALEVARGLIAKRTREAALVALALMSQLEGNAEACALVADLSAGEGEIATAARGLLSGFSCPQGVMSRTHGEPYPQLVQLEEMLGRAVKRAKSPTGREELLQMSLSIREQIAHDARNDEEEADPR